MENLNQMAMDYRRRMLEGECQFVNIKYDVAFKFVFGSPGNEDLLLLLLNAIIPEKHIVSVKLRSQEFMPDRLDRQRVIYDINCTTDDGSAVNVEMQLGRQSDFGDRMIYYSGFTARERVGEVRGLRYKLPQIYVIGILDFLMPDIGSNPHVINHFSVRNDADTSQALTDSMHYVTVELPKFNKRADELETTADCLFYLFRHLEQFKEIPEKFQGKNLDKLFSVAKFAAMDAQTQEQYLAQVMWEWDQESRLTTRYLDGEAKGRTEGRAEGLAEGRTEGLAEGQLRTARAMKENGISTELIVKCTGLTPEQIAAL